MINYKNKNLTKIELDELWSLLDYVENDEDFIFRKFTDFQNRVKRRKKLKQRRIMLSLSSIAAMFIILFMVYVVNTNDNSSQNKIASLKYASNELRNANATIEVNGTTYSLNSKSASLSQGDENISVITADGHRVKQVEDTEILKLSVPKGGQFEMTLSDGTKVWLNSDTELIYPAKFKNNRRDVTVKGEAFFDVAKNKNAPFVVSVDGKYDVKVIGTSFNIDSYEGAKLSKTTLVSGKVKVILPNSTKEIDLSPSEQLLWNESEVNVIKVNVEQYISWKDKRFVFDNTNLSDIVKEMKKCYGIDIILDSKYNNYKFSGKVGHNRGVDYFIKILNETEGINCQFIDNTLFIGDKGKR